MSLLAADASSSKLLHKLAQSFGWQSTIGLQFG